MSKLKLFITLCLTLIFSFSVFAENIKYKKLTDKLSALLESSELTAVSVHQGWVVSTAIVRCSTPEGTVDPSDEIYCAIASIDLTKGDEEAIEDLNLTETLSALLENSPVAAFHMGQGWVVYSAYLRCYNPAGTANPKDKLYCSLDNK